MWILWLACAEPLDLPDDPAAEGVPVGVRTIVTEDNTFEVYYPATDATADDEPESLSLSDFAGAPFMAEIGDPELPPLMTPAVRDAPVRRGADVYPVVLFSHGFGGFRSQSFSITSHLASRGYVVVSPDHPGRRMQDLLPCLFSPPLDGCNLRGFGEDPGPAGLEAALDWAFALPDDDPLSGRLDLDHIGVSGHSAGGGSTGTVLQDDPRLLAGAAMAMGPTVTRDVPLLALAGDCDGVVPIADVAAGTLASTNASLVTVVGAGHLAFSDLCSLDLGALAKDYLEGRDDLNRTIYDGLLALGVDGCPGYTPPPGVCSSTSYLDLATSDRIVDDALTRFLDETLR
jgi:dienelactone hydrolase